ncbi:MAG: hypothetical protein HY675_25005 [Chloroflexi bacterium]|nr:hypothetical protein [Chloroflexota bacterium]
MIEGYDFGRIVIDGKEYDSDVIVYTGHVDASWWRKEGHELHVEDIKETLDRVHPEVLVIGTGHAGRMTVLPETKDYLHLRGIDMIVEPTSMAVETYNRLSGSRKALAALHITC